VPVELTAVAKVNVAAGVKDGGADGDDGVWVMGQPLEGDLVVEVS
jgi:hypothetical protein